MTLEYRNARIYIHLQVIQFSQFSHHLDLHFVIVGFVIMAVIGWHVLSYTQCTGPPFINFWPICLPPIRPLLHIPFRLLILGRKKSRKNRPRTSFYATSRIRGRYLPYLISDPNDTYIFEFCTTHWF